jgi:hypothetical protein
MSLLEPHRGMNDDRVADSAVAKRSESYAACWDLKQGSRQLMLAAGGGAGARVSSPWCAPG